MAVVIILNVGRRLRFSTVTKVMNERGDESMDANELKERIVNLSIWKKGTQRAPHKPLLILYALARLQEGRTSLPYEEVRETLTTLLRDFGPMRKSYHPEEPFVRLHRDGIWNISVKREDVQISDRWLLENQISAGFNEQTNQLLTNNKDLIKEISSMVLHEHFPDSIHEDILTAVGLNVERTGKRVRDPKFRERILRAYEHSCAICGFNVRLGHSLVAVEAAHIKWHQAGGPDREENGLALCAMHHRLFDRGVFTLSKTKEIIVSQDAYGTNGFNEWLMRFHGKLIRKPIHPDYYPKDENIRWHVQEVFKGQERYRIS